MFMNLEKIKILGVNISVVDEKGIIDVVEKLVSKRKKIQIVTPNPEHIVQAQEDERFLDVLNSSDLAVPDGVGLVIAQKIESLKFKVKNMKNNFLIYAYRRYM